MESFSNPKTEPATFWKKFKLRTQDYLSWFWLLILVIYLGISAGRSIVANYRANQTIEALKNDILTLQLEKQRLEALAAYYQTDAYKEKELRKRLLLKRPGEKVIAFPDEYVKSKLPKETETDSEDTTKLAKPNYEKWIEYFRGEL